MFTHEELEVIEEALYSYRFTCETNAEARLVIAILHKIEQALND